VKRYVLILILILSCEPLYITNKAWNKHEWETDKYHYPEHRRETREDRKYYKSIENAERDSIRALQKRVTKNLKKL